MLVVCGYPLCYYNNSLVAIWDVVVNHIIPAIVIILCSATLLGRILYEKKHMHQPIRWRRHRKMTIQLLSISILYLILDIPAILLKFAYLCGVSKNIGADFMLCASSLPNLKKKIKRIFPCCRRHTHAIVPEVFHMSQKTDRRLARGPIHVY
jgi:phosphatidylglycerophosphate synthase